MSVYLYTLANRKLEKVHGRVEAGNREAAAEAIQKAGWFIVSLKPESLFLPAFFQFGRSKISDLERIIFTDHLAAMIESGTPLVEALETYQEDETKKRSSVIDEIIRNVQQGKKLSESMRNFPGIFSAYYAALVAAGEVSGSLDETFKHLAKELRREYEFKERVKSALMYPALVMSASIVVIIFLLFVVIPKITELTKTFGGELPLATRIVASAADLLTHYSPLVIAVIAALVVALVYFLRNPKTKTSFDPYILRLPLIGMLLKQYILARFLRLIGSCLSYGIPLTTTFDSVANVVDNNVYRLACVRLKGRVSRGMNLAQSMGLESRQLIPQLIVRTVRGAEKTGTVNLALIRLSRFFEDDVDRGLKRITDLIEPILTIVLGVIVAGIALAVVGPIYQLTSKIR